MFRMLLSLSSMLGCLGVVLGAFGAHFLKQKISLESLAVFEVGVRYQMYHVFAIFVSAWGFAQFQDQLFGYAAWLFVVGILLFSGSLYLIALFGLRYLGIITPIGGLCFVVGWICLMFGFFKNN